MPTLNFKGKQLVQNHHLVVPFHELKPIKAKSVMGKDAKLSLHDNVIMHGDNLGAIGVVPLLTGIFRFCPAYLPFWLVTK